MVNLDMFIILKHEKTNRYLLQRKVFFFTLTQQFDIPCFYTWFNNINEVVDTIKGIHSLSYCTHWVWWMPKAANKYKPIWKGNNIKELITQLPEEFI